MRQDTSWQDAARGWVASCQRSIALQAFVMALVTRVLLFGMNWYSLRVIPTIGPNAELGPVIGGWAIWDTAYYLRVAFEGYVTDDPGVPAFFPMYPVLIRGLLELFGLELFTAHGAPIAVALSNLCFLAAVPIFSRLVESFQGQRVALLASVLLCVSPFSFFFSAGYTESLFLLLVLLSLRSTTRRQWLLAGLFAGLASATRSTGIVLVPAILYLAWRERATWRQLASVAVLGSSGLVAFCGLLWWKLGTPLAFLDAQERWSGTEFRIDFFLERIFVNPSHLLYGGPDYHDLYVPVIFLNVALWALSLSTLTWVFRWTNPAVGIFTTLLVVSHGLISWISLGRYLLPAVGVYIVLAKILDLSRSRVPIAIPVVVAVCAMLLTMLMMMFGHGYWVI